MRANVEDRGMKGDCTPLMEAASAGHTEIVKLLISHCADVNAQSSSGDKKDDALLKLLTLIKIESWMNALVFHILPLIKNCLDNSWRNFWKLSLLLSRLHNTTSKLTLHYHCDKTTPFNFCEYFVIDFFTRKKNNSTESCFVFPGNTPLMYACAGGHESVVRLLLESGSHVEDHNENGHTPLVWYQIQKARKTLVATHIYLSLI